MDDYFTQQTDDEGVVTYVSVDTVTVDDEAFYADPRYKKVADRDANRRRRVTELNARIKAFEVEDTEDGVDTDTPPDTTETTEPATMTPEEIIIAAIAAIDQRNADADTAKTAQDTLLAGLVEKHKLDEGALQILAVSSSPEVTAELLGKAQLQFDSTDGGTNPGTQTDLESLMGNVNKKLGLDDQP